MVVVVGIEKLPDGEFGVFKQENGQSESCFSGSDFGAVESLISIAKREGSDYRVKVSKTPLTQSLLRKYGNVDKQNLLHDLEGEYTAIEDYNKHIAMTNNPVIKKELQHIRDEEEHHVDELKDLLEKEV